MVISVRGDLDGAEVFYRKSLVLNERLANETGTVETRRYLSVSYDNLGDLCQTRGDMDGAEEFYQKCLALSEQSAEETKTVEAYYDLAISYFDIAVIQKPWHWSLLEETLQITTALATQCPQIMQYSEFRGMIKHIFEQERNKMPRML